MKPHTVSVQEAEHIRQGKWQLGFVPEHRHWENAPEM